MVICWIIIDADSKVGSANVESVSQRETRVGWRGKRSQVNDREV